MGVALYQINVLLLFIINYRIFPKEVAMMLDLMVLPGSKVYSALSSPSD